VTTAAQGHILKPANNILTCLCKMNDTVNIETSLAIKLTGTYLITSLYFLLPNSLFMLFQSRSIFNLALSRFFKQAKGTGNLWKVRTGIVSSKKKTLYFKKLLINRRLSRCTSPPFSYTSRTPTPSLPPSNWKPNSPPQSSSPPG
jgi:hypothetical protein